MSRADKSTFSIIEARSPEQLDRVYRLRYQIYVEEMGRRQQYADHGQGIVCEPLDITGHVLSASVVHSDEVVATVRFNVGVDEHFGVYTELYRLSMFAPYFPSQVSITTKLMIAAPYRRDRLAVDLACFSYRRALELQACFDFIDCNPPLVPFFTRLGYRQVFDPVHHPEYGDVIPLVLVLHDVNHLQRIGSPFAVIARRFADRHHSIEFYRHLVSELPSRSTVASHAER